MDNRKKLVLVKAIHTAVWIFYNCVILYMLYAALSNNMDWLYWSCWGFVLLEGFILLVFRFTCPLTLVARRYTNDPRDNFDIYLPEWLAKNTKHIYTSIVVVILLLTLLQLARSQ